MPLKILKYMLENAYRIKPWKAEELSKDLKIPQSSIYRHLKKLRSSELIRQTASGYMLGSLILEAGANQEMHIARINTKNMTEELYGNNK